MVEEMKLRSFETQMIQKLTITVHSFIRSEYPDAIFEVMNLKQTGIVESYYEEFEGFCNLLQLSEEDALNIFINNLKSDISKPVSFFYPKTMTEALKLAMFYEVPRNYSSQDENLNNTPTVQMIIPPLPKQYILIKAMNPYYSLNPLKKSIYEKINEPKFDESSPKYFTVNSLLFKNLQPSVAGYKFGFVSSYEKLELIYSIVFMIENRLVVVYDPYRFRLLVMGNAEYMKMFKSGFNKLNAVNAGYVIGQNDGALIVVKEMIGANVMLNESTLVTIFSVCAHLEFLDLVKCNMYIDLAKYKSISYGFEVFLREQGAKGLCIGWIPTLFGHNVHSACQLGFYKSFKNLLHYMLLRKRVGVKSVTMHDGVVELWDLSNNFVFSKNDVVYLLGFNQPSKVIKACRNVIAPNPSCCSSLNTYIVEIQKQMLITNRQAIVCATMIGSILRKGRVMTNVYELGDVDLKDFSIEACGQQGCLLRSLSANVVFDNSTGYSFTCDLTDNIAAPWLSSSMSLCALEITLPSLPITKTLKNPGTLGSKCNNQMAIPHLIENYGVLKDPIERQAFICTVHSFSHNIDHFLTWARSEFESLFEKILVVMNANCVAVSVLPMLSKLKLLKHGKEMRGYILKQRWEYDIVVGTTLIEMYVNYTAMTKTEELVTKMQVKPNSTIWLALLTACGIPFDLEVLGNGCSDKTLDVCKELELLRIKLDVRTLSSLMPAMTNTCSDNNLYVTEMIGKLARTSLISWNVMIVVFMNYSLLSKSIDLYSHMETFMNKKSVKDTLGVRNINCVL